MKENKKMPDGWCGTPNAEKLEKEIAKSNGKEVPEDDFGMDFLGDKFKEADKKVESGEISCNLDNPEDCEACGS